MGPTWHLGPAHVTCAGLWVGRGGGQYSRLGLDSHPGVSVVGQQPGVRQLRHGWQTSHNMI